MKLRLVKTCGGCPEQYDVFHGEENVGYLRLRHGCFTADYKEQQVYSACPEGDGSFLDHERHRYLNEACIAIIAAMVSGTDAKEYEIPAVYEIES